MHSPADGAGAVTSSEVLSPRLVRAFRAAARAHAGQLRKGTDIPYIEHPCAVMYVASRQSLPEEIREDVLIACLLHDVVEDAPEVLPADRLRAEFGERVWRFVSEVTKDDSLPSWQDRAEHYLARLEGAELGSVIVAACDKLHNLSEILEDHGLVGPEIWGRFKRGKASQQWWYGEVLNVVAKRCPQLELLGEYRRKLEILRAL